MKTFVKFFYGPIIKIEPAINKYASDNNLEIIAINFQPTESIFRAEGKVYNTAVIFKEEKKTKALKVKKVCKGPRIKPLKPIFSPPAYL